MDINITTLAALVTIIFTLGGGLYKLIVFIREINKIREWKNKETKRCLSRLGFTKDEHFDYIKSPSLIPTMGQKKEPHDNDDLETSEYRFPLVDTLIKAMSKKDSIEKKRYAILAGSGMGKTTFAASFIYKFINRSKFRKPESSLYVYYLGNPNVLDEISKLDGEDAILLLDALDENVEATKDIGTFLSKLESVTNNFKSVIITSRTQFFADKKSEPGEVSVIQNNPNKESLAFEVIYISPFSDEETEKFLENRYNVPSPEYSKAHQLVEKSKKLMVRPMVLTFIDDLIGLADKKNLTNVELYKRIIEEWLERECKNQKDINPDDLYSFSKKLAIFIYNKWQNESVSYITSSEYNRFIQDNGYKSSPYSFRDRSLLNRRGDGAIKFAHKSFWEYFIAINSIENPEKQFNPQGLDMAVIFSKDIYALYLTDQDLPDISIPTPSEINICGLYDEDSILDVTDNYISELISKSKEILNCESLSPKEKVKGVIFKLCLIRENMLQQYSPFRQDLLGMFANAAKVALIANSLNDNSTAILFKHYSLELNSIMKDCLYTKIISRIQTCILNYNEVDLAAQLPTIEEEYYSIKNKITSAKSALRTVGDGYNIVSDALNGNDSSGYSVTNINKSVIILPYILGLGEEVINEALSHRVINVGLGIVSDNTFLKTIEYVMNKSKMIDTIVVHKGADCVAEYAQFIFSLSSSIETLSSLIMVRMIVDKIHIYYTIDEYSKRYTEKEIETIILNTISAKRK